MATSNPDEAEFTCKNPDCPKGVIKWNAVLNHISRAKFCKNYYTDSDISSIRAYSKECQKKNNAAKDLENYHKKRKYQDSKKATADEVKVRSASNVSFCKGLNANISVLHLNSQ